jgi:hypothetical protein
MGVSFLPRRNQVRCTESGVEHVFGLSSRGEHYCHKCTRKCLFKVARSKVFLEFKRVTAKSFVPYSTVGVGDSGR